MMWRDESRGKDIFILRNCRFFVFLLNLAELLSGQSDLIDILEAIFFLLLSAEDFVTYL
jgi:hypothetical protein